MGTYRLNKDAKGFTTVLPDGGMPVYLDDLQSLSYAVDIVNPYRNFNGVIWGCLTSAINTNTKSVTLTDGVIQIDGIQYFVPSATYTYPFAFKAATPTDDYRTFLDAGSKVVGKTYNLTTRTTFTLDGYGYIPTDYSIYSKVSEIFFNPFTIQRLGTWDKWNNSLYGEIRLIASPYSRSIAYTDTGVAIVGSPINNVLESTGSVDGNVTKNIVKLKFEGVGYSAVHTNVALTDINGNTYTAAGNVKISRWAAGEAVGGVQGNSAISLQALNIPQHNHDSGTLAATHSHSIASIGESTPVGGSVPTILTRLNPGNIVNYVDSEQTSSTLNGKTGNGQTPTSQSLSASGRAFGIDPSGIECEFLRRDYQLPYLFY